MRNQQYETLEDLLADSSFRRWAAGEAGDHIIFWESWLAQNQDKRDMAEKAVTILKGVPFKLQEKTLDPDMIKAEWEKMSSRASTTNAGQPERKGASPLLTGGLRIAASIAVLIGLGLALQLYVFNPVVEYRTPFGKQLTVDLPDSSTVRLNANSVLSYRRQNPRKVWLDGEAFFRVKKKPATGANFRVLTNDLTVEVLGTAFNVSEKKDETEVILEEGKVKLNLNRDFKPELLMEPGDLVAFSIRSVKNIEKRQVKAEVFTSWKDGVQEFEDVPLTEIMERIQAIYGWKAVFYDESLKTKKISIGLPSEDFDMALLILSKSMNVEIERVRKEEEKVLLLR